MVSLQPRLTRYNITSNVDSGEKKKEEKKKSLARNKHRRHARTDQTLGGSGPPGEWFATGFQLY